MLRLGEDAWAGKRRLLRLLADLESQDWCRQTLYLRPDSARSGQSRPTGAPSAAHESLLKEVRRKVGEPDTGLACFRVALPGGRGASHEGAVTHHAISGHPS